MKKPVSENVFYDPASVAGKAPPIADETDLLVIGCGSAGIAAALQAAGKGCRVMLVDENPVPLETMGEEVSLHFGGRAGALVNNRNAILERMLENTPELEALLDAGVDVRLGTAVWGLFPRRATTAWIDSHVAGLADHDRSYLLRFRQVVVAAGHRDMGLAFDGWEQPGVMGATAAYRLATTYGALEAKVVVLVGSGTEALLIATELSARGVKIAAIVERGEHAIGDSDLLSSLLSCGVQLYTRHVVQQANGNAYGITSVRLAAVDVTGKHLPDTLVHIECDTVLLGIAAVPSIELLEAAGCSTSYQAARGGYAAVVDVHQGTSLPGFWVAGDCAGTWASKSLSNDIARREGRIPPGQHFARCLLTAAVSRYRVTAKRSRLPSLN